MATTVSTGEAPYHEWTEHLCPVCKAQGITTVGGYISHLKLLRDGTYECDVHGPQQPAAYEQLAIYGADANYSLIYASCGQPGNHWITVYASSPERALDKLTAHLHYHRRSSNRGRLTIY